MFSNVCRACRMAPALALALAFTISCLPARASGGDVEAQKIIQTAGIRTGLCVHLGCGTSKRPGLTSALARTSKLLVHGVAFDEASLQRARASIEKSGVAGRAAPLGGPGEVVSRDLWGRIGARLLLTPFVLGCRRIGRPAGGVFLLLYGVYIYYALVG